MKVIEKVYTPLPRQGDICPVSGLKRGRLLKLIREKKVTAVHLIDDDAKRGSRLIEVESLLSYLDSKATYAE